MDVELSQNESEAVQKALRSYLSELRMEITDTDNPEYKRQLRDERADLEGAMAKLSGAGSGPTEHAPEGASGDLDATPVIRVVRLWWSTALG
jgi:hypothetical protein